MLPTVVNIYMTMLARYAELVKSRMFSCVRNADLACSQTAVDWMLAGFSANVIVTGQSGTGKSSVLLEEGRQSDGLVMAMLEKLSSSAMTGSSAAAKISMSCWELKQHVNVDLLQPSEGMHRQVS